MTYEEAIETFKHWIEYEKANKEKINKADELIEIQGTVLQSLEQKDKEIQELKKERDGIYEDYQDLGKELYKKDRQLDIKDAYNRLLVDIGCDYDGCETVESLKELIDELVDLSKKAIENNDTCVMYWRGKDQKSLNILQEEINNGE